MCREFFLMVFLNVMVFSLSLEIVLFLWLLSWGCWVSSAVVHAPWHLLPGLPPCVDPIIGPMVFALITHCCVIAY